MAASTSAITHPTKARRRSTWPTLRSSSERNRRRSSSPIASLAGTRLDHQNEILTRHRLLAEDAPRRKRGGRRENRHRRRSDNWRRSDNRWWRDRALAESLPEVIVGSRRGVGGVPGGFVHRSRVGDEVLEGTGA